MKLTFYITELLDGTLIVETYHMHYHFREELNWQGIDSNSLYRVMALIKATCKREKITPVFILR